jgi:hypothetical protein
VYAQLTGNFHLSPPASQALPQTITVQGRIRATGAAMSLPQSHEIRDLLSEDSEKNCHWSTTIGLASRSGRSEIRRDESLPTRLTFLEDFTVEHSDGGMRIEVMELAGIF